MSKSVFHRSCVKRTLFAVVLGLCIAGAISVATAAPTAYVQTSDGQLGTMNLTTGATSIIGSMGPAFNGMLNGLGAANGNLYVTSDGGSSINDYGQLWSINTTTGAATSVGASGIYYWAFGSTTSGLYAIGSPGVGEYLYSVNATTAAATSIGAITYPMGQGNILSTNSASLYDAYYFGGQLLSVDTTTGVETQIDAYDIAKIGRIWAMVEENGTLYGISGSGSINGLGAIVTIDPTTGVDTPTGATATYSYYTYTIGLAPYPLPSSPTTVPVPPGIVLSGIGLFGLVGFRKKLKIS